MNESLSSVDRVLQIESTYQANASTDLELMQAELITYADWARRQQEHCQKYYSDRAAVASA